MGIAESRDDEPIGQRAAWQPSGRPSGEVRRSAEVSASPAATKQLKPMFDTKSPPWSDLADENMWHELWKRHHWSLAEIDKIRSLFKALKGRENWSSSTLASSVVRQYMIESNPYLSSIQNDISLAITIGQTAELTATQFLRIAALCDTSTLHEMSEPSGRLRLALIFVMYDANFKGYLDEQDFSVMKHDISKIYGQQTPLLPVSILDLAAKTAPYMKGKNSQPNFNSPIIAFALFKESVESQVLRGTSQLMRARFLPESTNSNSHSMNPEQSQSYSTASHAPWFNSYESMNPMGVNNSIGTLDGFYGSHVPLPSIGLPYHTSGNVAVHLTHMQADQLMGTSQCIQSAIPPPALGLFHGVDLCSQTQNNPFNETGRFFLPSKSHMAYPGQPYLPHGVPPASFFAERQHGGMVADMLHSAVATQWSTSVNNGCSAIPTIQDCWPDNTGNWPQPIQMPSPSETAYDREPRIALVSSPAAISNEPQPGTGAPISPHVNDGPANQPGDNAAGSSEPYVPDSSGLGLPKLCMNSSANRRWRPPAGNSMDPLAQSSSSLLGRLSSPQFSPPPRIPDSFRPASPLHRPLTKDLTNGVPSRLTWPRDNGGHGIPTTYRAQQGNEKGGEPQPIDTTTTAGHTDSGCASPTLESGRYSRNPSIEAIREPFFTDEAVSHFRLQPRISFLLEEIAVLKELRSTMKDRLPLLDFDLLLFLASIHKHCLCHTLNVRNPPLTSLAKSVSDDMYSKVAIEELNPSLGDDRTSTSDDEELICAISEKLAPYLFELQTTVSCGDLASLLLSHYRLLSPDYDAHPPLDDSITILTDYVYDVLPNVQSLVLQAKEMLSDDDQSSFFTDKAVGEEGSVASAFRTRTPGRLTGLSKEAQPSLSGMDPAPRDHLPRKGSIGLRNSRIGNDGLNRLAAGEGGSTDRYSNGDCGSPDKEYHPSKVAVPSLLEFPIDNDQKTEH